MLTPFLQRGQLAGERHSDELFLDSLAGAGNFLEFVILHYLLKRLFQIL